jgi:hypothetical protein
MKVQVNIKDIQTVNEFNFYWNTEDYLNLLKAYDFPDADLCKKEEYLDLLFMAITDFEPHEAAEILLKYKLSEELNEGQIQSLSHEMLKDKVAEEYAEPALHFDLFNVNQLLYKAYNGIFPNTEASIINLEIDLEPNSEVEVDKELLIKALGSGLKENNLIKRLFEEQLIGNEVFTDAAKTIWKMNKIKENSFELITSKYWLDSKDFSSFSFEAEILTFEE